ncbi:MAG: alanine--tRNA ligase [Microbacteriaceae bacterium]|jgi:alanyl-tRNA synthetase|nr:alanine--tRNA ligase [Microbacteriaceae bacterium]
MQSADIRQRWLDFFAKRGHTIVPSASLISDDPSLLFTVAGMVPFIPYLTGTVPAPYPRAADCQKCIRTNDIEEVGKTARHGTFFQMLGNWSFGDYFKEGAIEYAWELLTSSEQDGGYGFDPNRLWVTVYKDDDEAHDLWRKIAGLPEERIQRFDAEDNYWSTGQPGPAGPCSEIYYDRGPAYGAEGGPEVDDTRFIEIWNLVFMQYQIDNVRSKTEFDIVGELPHKNIDTGMGLERVAFLKQGVENMYEIDQVRPVLDRAAELAGVSYGGTEHRDSDVRLRIVADHVRSAMMLIGDGVTPSNDGRGYVTRRLIRRTVRAMRLLGVQDPILPDLLPESYRAMRSSYPELDANFERISQIAYAEEDSFLRTLSDGTTILDLAIDRARTAHATSLPGSTAFTLHDTYGFPIDLTQEIAEEAGLKVDRTVFDELMAEQRNRAKADAKSKKTGQTALAVYAQFRDAGETSFLGYDSLTSTGAVLGLIRNGQSVPAAESGQDVEVILDATAFYAEGGGQVADIGALRGPNATLRVTDVQKPVKGLISHHAHVEAGSVAVGDQLTAAVDAEHRLESCQAHSATHLVHAALRQLLGPTATQSGSLNRPGYLRLDFAWNQRVEGGVLQEIEDITNTAVRNDLPVTVQEMPLEEARKSGAMALFGEKYGNVVRVVQIGSPWSRELCAGTHVSHSSQIGAIDLVGESSVGSGARRVEAFVGLHALNELTAQRTVLREISATLKTDPASVRQRVDSLVASLQKAQHRIADLTRAQLQAQVPQLTAKASTHGDLTLVAEAVDGIPDADALRSLAESVRAALGAGANVIALLSVIGGKPQVVVAASDDAVAKGTKAGALVSVAAKTLGGGGGGRPEFAQGGGTNPTAIPEALAAIEAALA